MRKVVAILAVLLSAATATTAGAHSSVPHRTPFSKMTLAQIERYQLRVIKLDRWVIRTEKAHKSSEVWWHRQQLKWTTRELKETRARLRPQIAQTNHQRGWSCITHGAHFNDTGYHEGNGYAGPYSGPLGMTDPWMTYNSPGSDWVHTPVNVVYAIAEKVAAQHGFSYGWMSGQWPHTFPPCAGYF